MTSGQGTVKWMSPEVLSNAPYTDKSDVYSLGLIVWEVLMQQPFFEELKFNSQIEIQVVNHDMRPPIPKHYSSKMRKLLTSSWAPNPNDRPTMQEVTEILEKISIKDIEPKQKSAGKFPAINVKIEEC